MHYYFHNTSFIPPWISDTILYENHLIWLCFFTQKVKIIEFFSFYIILEGVGLATTAASTESSTTSKATATTNNDKNKQY